MRSNRSSTDSTDPRPTAGADAGVSSWCLHRRRSSRSRRLGRKVAEVSGVVVADEAPFRRRSSPEFGDRGVQGLQLERRRWASAAADVGTRRRRRRRDRPRRPCAPHGLGRSVRSPHRLEDGTRPWSRPRGTARRAGRHPSRAYRIGPRTRRTSYHRCQGRDRVRRSRRRRRRATTPEPVRFLLQFRSPAGSCWQRARRGEFTGRREALGEALHLSPPEIRQPVAGPEPTDHPVDGDVRLAVADQHESRRWFLGSDHGW